MLALLSPAKKMNFETPDTNFSGGEPLFSKEAYELAKQLNDLSGTQRFAAVVAGGAAGETLVADVEKIGTFGDLFEAGPTELNREISEDPSEDASRKLANRLRFGAEGFAIGLGFSLLGKPASLGLKYGIMKPTGLGLKYGVGPVVSGALVVGALVVGGVVVGGVVVGVVVVDGVVVDVVVVY